jgi:glycylpeptide N-tetradecanoyltransferase
MIQKFKELSVDKNIHFQERDRFEKLSKILGEHKFWDAQPIMKYREQVKEGQIQQFKPEDISKEPTQLPPGFEWNTFDVNNDAEVDEICEFLMDHYVEDGVGNFRLLYSKEKFRWACASPGFIQDMFLLVRNTKNRKILGCIVGTPKKIVINGQNVKMCEVNFLAVHRSLRSKRMAQVMIQEMMRRKRINGFP